MKNILWIPSRCQNLHKEIVYLDVYVSDFRRWAREHPSFRTTRQQMIASQRPARVFCECCVRPTWPIAAHHIIPLWALAVDRLCALLARDDTHLQWGVWKEPRPYQTCPPSYERWNSRDNMQLLCADCHTTQEKESFATHRTALLKKYSPFLCFGRDMAEKHFWAVQKIASQTLTSG